MVAQRRRRRKQSIPNRQREHELSEGEYSMEHQLSEYVWKKGDLNRIKILGLDEHWLLKPSAVTLDEQSSATAQSMQRGFLYGTTEVWVKSATQDCTADDILTELRILRRARHGNIVAFYGSTLAGSDSICLVLEWVPGSGFEEYVKRRRNDGTFSDQLCLLTAQDACCQIDEQRLLVDVVRGMQYLHSQKPAIAHGGLTPSVVLVDERGTPCVAKLSNFSKSVLIQLQPESTDTIGQLTAGHSQLKVDIFNFGLVALFAMTSVVHDPSFLDIDDHLQKACQLVKGDVGGLASVLPVAESCLSDACPSFTEIFYSLSPKAGQA
jgi:serine/threonine protein kinase